MLSTLLIAFLLTSPTHPAADFAQAGPTAAAGAESIKLSETEISDLQKKAEAGGSSAQYSLGRAYESGNGVPKRAEQAAIWYRKAADQGNARLHSLID
jgi:TPR repeat protein